MASFRASTTEIVDTPGIKGRQIVRLVQLGQGLSAQFGQLQNARAVACLSPFTKSYSVCVQIICLAPKL